MHTNKLKSYSWIKQNLNLLLDKERRFVIWISGICMPLSSNHIFGNKPTFRSSLRYVKNRCKNFNSLGNVESSILLVISSVDKLVPKKFDFQFLCRFPFAHHSWRTSIPAQSSKSPHPFSTFQVENLAQSVRCRRPSIDSQQWCRTGTWPDKRWQSCLPPSNSSFPFRGVYRYCSTRPRFPTPCLWSEQVLRPGRRWCVRLVHQVENCSRICWGGNM